MKRLLLTILLTSALTSIAPVGRAQSLETLLEQGRTALKEKKYTEAEQIWQQVVQLAHKNAEARTKLCESLGRLEKLKEALAQCQKAVELDPKSSEAYSILGTVLRKQKQFNEAITAYHQAIQLDPQNASPHRGLGNTLKEEGKLDEAIEAYRQAISVAPTSINSYDLLGFTLAEQGKLDEAVKVYRQATGMATDDLEGKAWVYNGLGLALRAKAMQLTLKVNSSGEKELIAIGNYSDAITAYRNAINLAPKEGQHYYGWLTLLETMQVQHQGSASSLESAIAELQQRVKEDYKNSAPWFYLGALLKSQRRFAEAETAFRQYLELNPEGNQGLLWTNLSDQGKTSEALAIFKQMMSKNPSLDNWAAYAYRKLSQLDQAEAAGHRLLKLDPQSVEYHDTLGDILASAGKWAEAEAIYRQGLALKGFAPTSKLSAQTGLAVTLREQGKLPEALATHRQALAMRVHDVGIHFYMAEAQTDYGDTLKAHGKLSEAVAAYQRAVRIYPAADTYLSLGEGWAAQKRYSEAIDAYRQATKLLPSWDGSAYTVARSDAIAYNGIGKVLQAQGNKAEAIKHYALAVKADPNYLEAKANLEALNQGDDLQRLLAGRAWIKEKTKEYPYRIVIQLGDGSELSIRSTEIENKDNLFFKFELQDRKNQQFIVPINATLRGYVMSEIPYHLDKERDLLIIEGGQVITWQKGSRKEIDLRGKYTSWFPTVSQQN